MGTVASAGSRDRAIFVALLVALLASLAWLVHPWFDAVNDAALYLLTAKSIAAGEGYTYLGSPFVIRPPGFSVLLAPLVAWRGLDFYSVNLAVSLCGVLAIALFFLWTRERLGAPLAACAALVLWLNPGWRVLGNQAMSDLPGAALLLAGLLLERSARRAPSWRRDALLGACIGLSAYGRAGLIVLVPAVLAQRIWARWREGGTPWPRFARERLLLVGALPFLLLLPWRIRDAAHHPDPPADQTSLYDYSTAMWHVDRGDPSSPRCTASEILARVPVRARETLATLGGRMRLDAGSPVEVAAGAVALALGLLLLLRRNRAEGWFLLGTVALMLVYFDFRERLVLPVHLLVLAALAEGLLRGGERLLGARGAGLALAAALAALAVVDFDPHPGWDEIEREHLRDAERGRELASRLPADARLAAPFASWRYAIRLDRPVYTLFFGWNRGGGEAGAEAIVDEYGIDRVLLSSDTPADRMMRPYFEQRYGVEERVGDLSVVRVR